jgi:hypothetical protein
MGRGFGLRLSRFGWPLQEARTVVSGDGAQRKWLESYQPRSITPEDSVLREFNMTNMVMFAIIEICAPSISAV